MTVPKQGPGCRLLLRSSSWEVVPVNSWLGGWTGCFILMSLERGVWDEPSSLEQVPGGQWEATKSHTQTGLGFSGVPPGVATIFTDSGLRGRETVVQVW